MLLLASSLLSPFNGGKRRLMELGCGQGSTGSRLETRIKPLSFWILFYQITKDRAGANLRLWGKWNWNLMTSVFPLLLWGPAFHSPEWIPSRLSVRLFRPLSTSVNVPTFTVRKTLPAPANKVKARASTQECSSANGTCPLATNILPREPTQGRTQQSEWIVSFGKGEEMTNGRTSLYVFWWTGDLLLYLPNKIFLQVNTLRWSVLFACQTRGIKRISPSTYKPLFKDTGKEDFK